MKKTILMFLLVFSSIINAQSGTIKVSGKVVDNTGFPVPGVTVASEGNGTVTDFDGTYVIMVKSSKSVVKFTYIGFAEQSLTVGTKKTLDVTLVEQASVLDDVVVIGYGTQKRSSVTGSVAKVKSEKFETAPVARLDNALQGKIAGVRIQTVSSEAGADTKINIRGVSSIGLGTGPLVIVDGQPFPDGFGALNSADVSSVEVLKDAASAAIYGSRGANGVIIVTTKSGKEGKTKYNFRSTTGVRSAKFKYDQYTSTEYYELLSKENDLRAADSDWSSSYGSAFPSKNHQFAQYYVESELLDGKGTDWQDEVLRTGFYQDLQFSVSGGSKKNNYYVSLGYQGDEGIMENSDFQKLNVRIKFNLKLTEKLNLKVNLNPSNTLTQRPETGYIDFLRSYSYLPVYHTQKTADYINSKAPSRAIQVGAYASNQDFANLPYSGLEPNGMAYSTSNATPSSASGSNPYQSLMERDNNRKQFRLQGSVGLKYDFSKDFYFDTTQNIYYKSQQQIETGNTGANKPADPNYVTKTDLTSFDFLTENTLNYSKSIGNHSLGALAGFTLQSTKSQELQTAGNTFPSNQIENLNYATVVLQPVQEDLTVGLISFLGRANYSYKEKYLLMASYRRDGSSKFGPGNKWGGFPAASLGWVISGENFMSGVKPINRLALRASYGATGNNNIDDYRYDYYLERANYATGAGTGTVSNGLGNVNDAINNPDITWERTFQTNLGLDLSMFRNRVTLNVDVYESNTEKLLLDQSVMGITGSTSTIANVGSLQNRGYEVELSTVNVQTPNFSWLSDFNISGVKNEITSLGEKTSISSDIVDSRDGLNMYAVVGKPLVSYFGYKTDGVWVSNDFGSYTNNTTGSLVAGGLKIVDVDGDGQLTAGDRTYLGNPYPDFIWGFNNKFTYKNFDVSFLFQGSVGGEVINGDMYYNETKRSIKDFGGDRWVSPNNPGDGQTPYDKNGINWILTDYAVQDATYTSLRECTIGYSLGKETLDRMGITQLRLSLSGQNLLYFTNDDYTGINIEARNNDDGALVDGYQRGVYPTQQGVLFGVELGF